MEKILTDIPAKFYSVSFPKICYNYRVQDSKKIVEPIRDSLFECQAVDLWRIENLSKLFDVTYEDCIFNMSSDKPLKLCLRNPTNLIFEFNKII